VRLSLTGPKIVVDAVAPVRTNVEIVREHLGLT